MTVPEVLRWLERRGRARNVEGMARYGIRSPKAFGVSTVPLRALARRIGTDHALALALWETGWHEARALATLVGDSDRVTAAQMERWCRDFDNWAVCDAACFQFFDRTPHAWRKAEQWSRRDAEFVKRGAFALIAGRAVHDKRAADSEFLAVLPIILRGATDDRHFVKKAVNWALRQIGKRNLALNQAAVVVAKRLAGRPERAPRWIGKDALRELTSAAVQQRLLSKSP